ncbi:MAG: 50S ribosomal protein L24 [Candidatus Tagabacteria bacterium RIFCSPLOWO2_01_FULL_39_11]|uniref:Large ribosomal subunit protein uL24 n=1 Tax=Candidatus Tagabacteria bacterium RIFCSPLOWO2_01_FULL_39_11 TaxID=1802295 RepID=A0A1G2LRU6_9BACT|nr:MAG: 50S ribosomal protein L24 [Candidatus Tagabacteria bacterium RIFCSPLOWO2_01_FULL_39_11]
MIKKDDNVMVIAGKDKGKTGKVLKVFPKESLILVENANIKKKHIRPKREGKKGQVVQMPAPFHVSNVMIVCKNCGKKTRTGGKILESGAKIRICKKCAGEL